jgi:hypothetical protein
VGSGPCHGPEWGESTPALKVAIPQGHPDAAPDKLTNGYGAAPSVAVSAVLTPEFPVFVPQE